MSRRSPFEVFLSSEQRAILKQRASSRSASHREVIRARIVLLAADGLESVEIARRVVVCVAVTSKWRKRFCQEGIGGLVDRHRSGRPRRFDAKVVAGVKAMACEPPEQRDVPLSRWSSLERAAQAVAEGLVESISSSTVRRSQRRSSRGACGRGSSRAIPTWPERPPGCSTSMPGARRHPARP